MSFLNDTRKSQADVEVSIATVAGIDVQIRRGEFWTARQRQASNLHEVSYRACFKPQLPRFFIERFTGQDEVVYDPFGGRGTTAIEAALLGRAVISNDINPLSRVFAEPRLELPDLRSIERRLQELSLDHGHRAGLDLSMFYHEKTEREIVALRDHLRSRRAQNSEDACDRWIRMVATNRLTGHSSGFFSVYSFPPNQAVSAEAQRKINIKREQVPPYRDVKAIIWKKTRQLQAELSRLERRNLHHAAQAARFLNCDSANTRAIADESVALTVTSPPFLDIVQYAEDNWLRCWFNDIDTAAVAPRIAIKKTEGDWSAFVGATMKELFRVTRRGGHVAFEVGEIRRGKLRLEELVLPVGIQAGFECRHIMINEQSFTKTANIWGVKNNEMGTNSNRIVLLRKPE